MTTAAPAEPRAATAESQPRPSAPRAAAVLFAAATFVGAFLLFQVQPLIAKFILPWFGGTPAVWTVCMLFFQTLLLAGYGYAHLLTTRLPPRRQVLVHVGLLGLAVASLAVNPVMPADALKPRSGDAPVLQILIVLTLTVGLPYLALSATSPLVQAWYSRTVGAVPYRLYALSNVGSLLALLSYPFVVEPLTTRRAQAVGWSVAMAGFAVVCALAARHVWRATGNGEPPVGRDGPAGGRTTPPSDTDTRVVLRDAGGSTIDVATRFRPPLIRWVLLPAIASALLLATTNTLCQDVAVVPFLWVLPLSLYLVTFIVAFDHPRWYARWAWMPWAAVGVALLPALFFIDALKARSEWLAELPSDVPIEWQVVVYCAAMFLACMVCHGEVTRLRPPPRHLTLYFLAIATGGAVGGVLVGVVAPVVLNRFAELHVGYVAFAVAALACLYYDPASPLHRGKLFPIWTLFIIVVFVFAWTMFVHATGTMADVQVVRRVRNFYGVLTVYQDRQTGTYFDRRVLQHGTITHGQQWLHPDRVRQPNTYYSPDSGAGLALLRHPVQSDRRIGVVGLGAGTLAAYGLAGDVVRFYEINPAIAEIARTDFSFIADSPADVELVMGDARLSMERELRDGGAQGYHVLLLDAFSGDAIPAHLLTREAFELYLAHLKPDGVIVVHVSNRHLDLEPVLYRVTEALGLHATLVQNPANDEWGFYESDWVMISRDPDLLKALHPDTKTGWPLIEWPEVGLWTDDYTSLYRILK